MYADMEGGQGWKHFQTKIKNIVTVDMSKVIICRCKAK